MIFHKAEFWIRSFLIVSELSFLWLIQEGAIFQQRAEQGKQFHLLQSQAKRLMEIPFCYEFTHLQVMSPREPKQKVSKLLLS